MPARRARSFDDRRMTLSVHARRAARSPASAASFRKRTENSTARRPRSSAMPPSRGPIRPAADATPAGLRVWRAGSVAWRPDWDERSRRMPGPPSGPARTFGSEIGGQADAASGSSTRSIPAGGVSAAPSPRRRRCRRPHRAATDRLNRRVRPATGREPHRRDDRFARRSPFPCAVGRTATATLRRQAPRHKSAVGPTLPRPSQRRQGRSGVRRRPADPPRNRQPPNPPRRRFAGTGPASRHGRHGRHAQARATQVCRRGRGRASP